jgi:glycosyltransferase involved in cell wall biosynthesis
LIKLLFKLPDKVLAISNANRRDILKNTGVPERRTRLIYLGFEIPAALPPFEKRKEVLTIGEVSRSNLKRKGLDFFVKTAAAFPEIPFVLAGKWTPDGTIEILKKAAPPNVRFTGALSDEELQQHLSRAAVYAQLSYHEAFGCAVAEAMLYECVPVVTRQYALPEVVGDAGYLVEYGNFPETIETIRKALNDKESGKRARQRVLLEFPLERRRQELQTAVESL